MHAHVCQFSKYYVGSCEYGILSQLAVISCSTIQPDMLEHPHNVQLGQEGGYPRHLAQCLKGKSTNKSCQDRPDQ